MAIPQEEITFNKKRGPAFVNVGEGQIEVQFEDEDSPIVLTQGMYPQDIFTGNMYVHMDLETGELFDFNPAEGTYYMTFDNFLSGEDEPPRLMLREGGEKRPWGTTKDAFWTMAFFRIVDGEFKGKTVPKYLWLSDSFGNPLVYRYRPGSDIAAIRLSDHPSSRAKVLENFLLHVGLNFSNDTIVMPEDGEYLAYLEDLIKTKQRILMGVVSGGFIDTLTPVPDSLMDKLSAEPVVVTEDTSEYEGKDTFGYQTTLPGISEENAE